MVCPPSLLPSPPSPPPLPPARPSHQILQYWWTPRSQSLPFCFRLMLLIWSFWSGRWRNNRNLVKKMNDHKRKKTHLGTDTFVGLCQLYHLRTIHSKPSVPAKSLMIGQHQGWNKWTNLWFFPTCRSKQADHRMEWLARAALTILFLNINIQNKKGTIKIFHSDSLFFQICQIWSNPFCQEPNPAESSK